MGGKRRSHVFSFRGSLTISPLARSEEEKLRLDHATSIALLFSPKAKRAENSCQEKNRGKRKRLTEKKRTNSVAADLTTLFLLIVDLRSPPSPSAL